MNSTINALVQISKYRTIYISYNVLLTMHETGRETYAQMSTECNVHYIYTVSHLCVLSEEPVLVATLHTKYCVFVLLLNLHVLLLKGSVDAFGSLIRSCRFWRTPLKC